MCNSRRIQSANESKNDYDKRCHERSVRRIFDIREKALIPLNPRLEANNQKILIFVSSTATLPDRRRLFACLEAFLAVFLIFFACFQVHRGFRFAGA